MEYDNDAHTAYLQVLVALVSSINGIGAKPEDIQKAVSAKMRKDIQTQAFESFKSEKIDQFISRIVERGTLQEDVVFEKTIKLISQLCILSQSVGNYDGITVVKEQNFQDLLQKLISKYLVNSSEDAPMSDAQNEDAFDPELFTTVLLDNFGMIVESNIKGFYSQMISNQLFEQIGKYDDKLISTILKKELWTDLKSLQFVT